MYGDVAPGLASRTYVAYRPSADAPAGATYVRTVCTTSSVKYATASAAATVPQTEDAEEFEFRPRHTWAQVSLRGETAAATSNAG